MFSSHKTQNVAGNPGGGYSDNTGTHSSNTAANLDPADHSQGLNSGYNNNTHGHSTVAGAALDPNDHRTGINSGNTGGNYHSTHTGAALDPTDHRTGVNSGNTATGTGYNNHSTHTGAALDPTDHRTGLNSNNNNLGMTGTGHHHTNDVTTNSALGHNIGPGPHHTAGADVPVGANTMYHGHTAGTTGAGTGLAGSHNTTGTTGTTGVGATHGGAHSTTNPPGVKSKEIVGKVEVAVGKVLHSASLVNKGEIKLEQAQSIRAQGAELSEAERLEHEAQLRRGRADAHGAAAAGHGHNGLTQPGVAGPGGPVGLDGGFAGQTAGHHVM